MSQPPFPPVPDDRVPGDVPDDRPPSGWSGWSAGPPPPTNPYGYPGAPGLNQAAGPYGQPGYGPPPSSNLVWGILSTLVCCMPLGIVSIVKAASVNSLWFQGRHDEALRASASAKNWAIASAAVGVGGVFLYFLLFTAAIPFSATTFPSP